MRHGQDYDDILRDGEPASINARGALCALPERYTTDAYPRKGCTLGVDVQEGGYSVTVFAPAPWRRPIERYFWNTPDELQRWLQDWAAGRARPGARGEGWSRIARRTLAARAADSRADP